MSFVGCLRTVQGAGRRLSGRTDTVAAAMRWPGTVALARGMLARWRWSLGAGSPKSKTEKWKAHGHDPMRARLPVRLAGHRDGSDGNGQRGAGQRAAATTWVEQL